MSAVGIGVIGVGFARVVQVPALLGCPGLEVVSLASASVERARTVAQGLGIAHAAESWRELVSHPKVDLVLIATPPHLHREMTLAALEAGKAVVCEKPTALDAREAEAMWKAAQGRGLLALVDHELRFLPAYQRARQLVQTGELGDLCHARVVFRMGARTLPTLTWNWWSDASRGGGILGAIGSHAVDTLRFLLSREPTDVSSMLKTHVRQLPDSGGQLRAVTADDEAHLLLRFGEESTAAIILSAVEPGPPTHVVELVGTRSALRIEKQRLWTARGSGSTWQAVELPEGGPLPPKLPDTEWAHGFLRFARALEESLRTGTRLEAAATLKDGWHTQRILDAARLAHAERRWINLPEPS